MEVTQFTYFQQAGGIDLDPVSVELTYGLERLAMYLQGVDTRLRRRVGARRDLRRRATARTSASSRPTTSRSPTSTCCCASSTTARRECRALPGAPGLPLPAYDQVLKCSHAFNLLDARGAISVTERVALHRPRAQPRARRRAGLRRAAHAVEPRGRRGRRVRADLLVELGCEELPQGACAVADANAARRRSSDWLERQRLLGGDVARATSRRAASPCWPPTCPSEQPPERVEHRGPPENVARGDDGWTKAGEGFARAPRRRPPTPWSCATASSGSSATPTQATPATSSRRASSTALVDGLQIPKNMRWGSETLRFARPIRTLVGAARRAAAARGGGRRALRAAACAGTASCAPELELRAAPATTSTRSRAARRRRRRPRSGARSSAPRSTPPRRSSARRGATPAACSREVVYLVERAARAAPARFAPSVHASCPTPCS